MTGIYKNCLVCGAKFWTMFKEIKRGKGKYCSQKCFHIARKGVHFHIKGRLSRKGFRYVCKPISMETAICKCCKKRFTYVKRGSRKGGIFCSLKCSGLWNAKKRHRATNIELLLEVALLKRKINYRKQVIIGSIGVVDFLLPHKLIIQCDGDYWHSFVKIIAKDKKQDAQFIEMGYKILRFSENALINRFKKCWTIIKRNLEL